MCDEGFCCLVMESRRPRLLHDLAHTILLPEFRVPYYLNMFVMTSSHHLCVDLFVGIRGLNRGMMQHLATTLS